MSDYLTKRQHRCTRNHRTYKTWAACAWLKGLDGRVEGEGPFAAFLPCNNYLLIGLFDNLEQARLKASWSCGGFCDKSRHRLIKIEK